MLPIRISKYRFGFVNRDGTTPHTHTYTSELIQTNDNHGKIVINDKTYNMHQNGLYFIHGQTPHFIIPDNLNNYNHSIIVFDTYELERLCSNLDMLNEYRTVFTKDGGSFCLLSDDDALKASEFFLKAKQILNDTKEMKYARLSSIICDLLLMGYENKFTEDSQDTPLTNILSFISNNLSDKISIDELSYECGLSKYHMCRFFKEKMGVTIGDFIKGQRLAYAKQLLLDKSLSINTIAQKCGYSDGSFFSKVFSAEEGCTPSAFRDKHK